MRLDRFIFEDTADDLDRVTSGREDRLATHGQRGGALGHVAQAAKPRFSQSEDNPSDVGVRREKGGAFQWVQGPPG